MPQPAHFSRSTALRALIFSAALLQLGPALDAQKKEKEEETQVLELPRELPQAVVGETRRLRFVVTPLSAKGLLSQQVRDALKALAKSTKGEPVLHLRAFVAGSGDLRRVRDLVSEHFTSKRQPLPALSLIRAGGLPLTGAQVLMEATVSAKKEINPNGLAFLSAQPVTSENPLDPVAPLSAKALASLRDEVKTAGAGLGDVVRVTCYVSSLENLAATRMQVESEYPRAAASYVQNQRAPFSAVAACEAVARLPQRPGAPLKLAGGDSEVTPGQSRVALVGADRVVLTGTQSSFGYQEADTKLAFERVGAALKQAGAGPNDVAWASYYPLAPGIAGQLSRAKLDFFGKDHQPAGATLLFEGLPSMDAGFAMDLVAVRN